jgi:hypothetical protein
MDWSRKTNFALLEDTDVRFWVRDDGIIEMQKRMSRTQEYSNETIRQIMEDNEIEGVNLFELRRACEQYAGRPFSAFLLSLQAMSKTPLERKKETERKKKMEEAQYNSVHHIHKNIVVGVDKRSLEMEEDSFTIIVVLNSSLSYHQQRDLLFYHSPEWLPGVVADIQHSFHALRGKMDDYYLSRVSITYINEAVLRFQKKKEVE